MGITDIPEVVRVFYQKRTELLAEIDEHRAQVSQHNVEIGRLEKDIQESRPLLEGCFNLKPCVRCDVYSLKLDRTVPQQGETEKVYKCVICNNEQSYM